MIPKECKRLAEVDFPIAVVSKHAAREKSIRHGHPSTLHLWWARRPLASSRAVLLGLLLPDPCDPACPTGFKVAAKRLLPQVGCGKGETDDTLRQGLLKFIGDFANWDLAAHKTYIDVARALVQAANAPADGSAYEPPLVVDPFSGGGSIPLEALRLGCEAFASDLNPVACLILKVMLEDIPREGPKLAEDLRQVGAEIKREAEKELADLYPKDPDGATPIAYLWARTVRCESPDCGAVIPLMRTGWLAMRKNKSGLYTKLISLDLQGDKRSRTLTSSITTHEAPTRSLPDAGHGTIKNGKATCPCCGRTMSGARVKAQLSEQNGGTDSAHQSDSNSALGASLMAVIVRGKQGLTYRCPTSLDLTAVDKAQTAARRIASAQGYDALPNEPINPMRPSPNARGVSGATRIGISDFGRLFTARQKVALRTLLDIVSHTATEKGVARCLTLAITKLAERSSSFVTWINSTEAPRGTFARQALTIAWDFIELVPFADAEEYLELIDAMAVVAELTGDAIQTPAQIEQAAAANLPLPDEAAAVVFTDPPYYDAIPYADLADFFLVWLKRAGAVSSNATLDAVTGLSPKAEECTWNRAHLIHGVPKTPESFEEQTAEAFLECRRVLANGGVGCIVFAHKTTEGWEALLSGLIKGGLSIHASWPVATERRARLNAKQSAALATSVHLICRPRPDDAGVGDWGKVLHELPRRVGDWMERLQGEGVRGADLVFACIGPALEIFSRYEKVETADGHEVTLTEFLPKVWEVVGRAALENVLGTAEAKARNGSAGALEEDARLTALFLWTLDSSTDESADDDAPDGAADTGAAEDDEAQGTRKKLKGFTLPFDVTRRFAQPLGIDLDKWKGRIIETEKGIVRLLPVAERARQLFGDDGAQAVAARIEEDATLGIHPQLALFPDAAAPPTVRGRRGHAKAPTAESPIADDKLTARHEATTLDRVHAAMLLQSGGRASALRALLKAEVERSPDFLRLANALSALYPRGAEEKRLLDAMLLAAPK